MKFVIVGKNIEVTPGLDQAVRDKIGKLDKYFSEDTTANVTLNVEARDQAEGSSFKREFLENSYPEDDEIRIVRKKQFDMKPMYPEDACVQMELLGHNFYVFRNAEDEQICVVYKRKGGTYGMIEPEE